MNYSKKTKKGKATTQKILVSFIVPCKNESSYIEICIRSILSQKSEIFQYELIVIDNGSTDGSIEIIKKFLPKIYLILLPKAKISNIRNHGARIAKGTWLAFIDGDVEIDSNWSEEFIKILKMFEDMKIDKEIIVTGSTCNIPKDTNWIQKVWHEQLLMRDKKNDRYINSGHLIVHRKIFRKVDGFDSNIETGEDEKFCEDARLNGALIIKNKNLRVIHYGYPSTTLQFFNRERWHGKGMRSHLRKPWKYRDLQLGIYNWCIFFILIIIVICGVIDLQNSFILLMLFFIPIFMLSIFRCKENKKNIIPLTYLYCVYGIAKSYALIGIFKKILSQKLFYYNRKK